MVELRGVHCNSQHQAREEGLLHRLPDDDYGSPPGKSRGSGVGRPLGGLAEALCQPRLRAARWKRARDRWCCSCLAGAGWVAGSAAGARRGAQGRTECAPQGYLF